MSSDTNDKLNETIIAQLEAKGLTHIRGGAKEDRSVWLSCKKDNTGITKHGAMHKDTDTFDSVCQALADDIIVNHCGG